MKNEKENCSRDTRFNVQKPLQHRGEKPRVPAANTLLYREVFTNIVDYLIF
jgi:hypothetical protein